MSIHSPHLDNVILKKVNDFVTELKTFHNQYNDVSITVKGYLKSGHGVKIVMENMEELDQDDIDYWSKLANKHDIETLSHIINMSTGKVELTVEYKRPSKPSINIECLMLMIILTSLTQILYKTNPERWEIINLNLL